MRKKITAVLVAFMLVLLTITGTLVGASSAAEQKTFSLQQAVDYALENNSSIAIMDTGIEKAKVSFREANSVYKKADDADVEAFSSLLEKDGYYKQAAELGLKQAELEKQQAIESIKYSVENTYFGLLNAKENLDIQNSVLQLAKEDLNIANEKYNLGTISEIEMISFKTSLATAEAEQKSAVRALEYAQMNFNKALGLPLNTEVSLTDELRIEAPSNIDIEASVADGLQNRMEVILAKAQYELNKSYFDITAKWYPSNTFKYQAAKQDVEESEYTIIDTDQTIEIAIRKAYMDMLDAYESLIVLEQSENQVQKAYDVAKVKYDNGMGTNTEVLDAMNALKETRLNKAQAQLAYKLACIKFKASYGIGL